MLLVSGTIFAHSGSSSDPPYDLRGSKTKTAGLTHVVISPPGVQDLLEAPVRCLDKHLIGIQPDMSRKGGPTLPLAQKP